VGPLNGGQSLGLALVPGWIACGARRCAETLAYTLADPFERTLCPVRVNTVVVRRIVARLRPAGRLILRAVVARLPGAVADRLRALPLIDATTPAGRLYRALLTALRHGGIPAGVQTFRLADNPARSFISADSLVLAQLYWFGERGWEPELLGWWRYLCRHSSTVLELGANVGYFTVQGALAAPATRYIAVEPHPTSLALCRSHLRLNGVTWVDVVAAAAVAGPAGTARLLVPDEQLAAPTVAFVDADGELPRKMAGPLGAAIEVPAVDVRTLLNDVDLLKLDVEGQEHALLAAAQKHLRAQRPTIVVEVLPGTVRLRRLLGRLCHQLGYRCYIPRRRGLVLLDPARLGEVDLLDEYAVQDLILSVNPDLPPAAAELLETPVRSRAPRTPPGSAQRTPAR
jgi:FkbM family methyltransferase